MNWIKNDSKSINLKNNLDCHLAIKMELMNIIVVKINQPRRKLKL